MSRRSLRHIAEYLFVRIALALIQALSWETCRTLCVWIAWVAADVIGIRRRIVEENLKIALPEKSAEERSRIARRMWRHLLFMICETALIHRKIHDTNWRRYVTLFNAGRWMSLACRQGAKVCVTGHFGNFEALGYVSNFWGFRTYTVARTLDNPFLDRLVRRFRESKGQRILPTHQSASQADEVLTSGGTLALLGDQHANSGCVVDFLGRPASCHKAVALFALLNRAPIMVATCSRGSQPMHFVMGMDAALDPLDNPPEYESVEELTQWYNDVLATRIRRQPDQYWWLHDRWKSVRAKKKRKRKRGDQSAPAVAQRPAA